MPNCVVPMLGDPTGPNPNINRFKVHSLPKETVKKLHGLETLTVDFMNAPSYLKDKNMSFSKMAKLQAPLAGASQVNDDYFWRNRVKSEQHAVVRAAGGLRPSTSGSSIGGEGGGGEGGGRISARSISSRPNTSGSRVPALALSKSCPAIPALSGELDSNCSNLGQSAVLRQEKYNKMRSSVKSRQAAEFADTLASLDQKLQAAREKAKDPKHRAKAKQAVRSLTKLVDKIKAMEVRNIRWAMFCRVRSHVVTIDF